ncbi:MAG: heparinase II/III family protein [Acidobacteria bacterium]|nr:heparinase II/III family protein [Acidobacteriota bacterium]
MRHACVRIDGTLEGMFSRRNFLARSAALAASTFVNGPITLLAQAQTHEPWPPKHLLTQTFTPLATSLLRVDAWRPYPRAGETQGWERVAPEVRAAVLAVADEANSGDWPQLLATDELEFKRNGNRSHFEALHFGRRARLGKLALGESIDPKGKYIDQVANGLWLVCEETFWGVPAHLGGQKDGVGLADVSEPIIDLFAAETAATVAWIVYLLEQQLDAVSPELVKRAHAEITRRILGPYLTRNDFWWMGLNGKPHHLNNWNPWINSNVLTAALIVERDPQRRAQLVEKVCRSADEFLGDCSPDGACEEGPAYWTRAGASFFDICNTLVSAHGGQGGSVWTHPYLRALGHYIADMHIANLYYVNFGDVHLPAAPEPELAYRFGRATNDATLAEMGAFDSVKRGMAAEGAVLRKNVNSALSELGSLSRGLAAVMCSAEIRKAKRHDALTRDAWYSSLGLMVAREQEGSTKGFYTAMQAASNGRSHGHNDSGSFMVFYNGQPVFIDVGVGTYTAQTFNKDRYKIWTMQSAFHNLPTIAGVMQHEGRQYKARVLDYNKSDSASSLRVDLAPAYPKTAGVQSWKRTVTLDRAAHRVLVDEEFLLAQAGPVMLTFMCAHEAVIQKDGVRVGEVLLGFDASVLEAVVERIALTDPSLKHAWGDAVWRVLLKSKGDVARGKLSMEMRRA